MQYTRWFAGLALAAGMALPGASLLSAADRDWRDTYHDRQDMRSDYRDMRNDYRNVERLRADIARDQWKLNEDIRCGRSWAASQDARDLARDQRALAAQYRVIQRDRVDLFRDRRDLNRDYRGSWRYR
jgi:hypothetical protein